jgi:phage tail-like protein
VRTIAIAEDTHEGTRPRSTATGKRGFSTTRVRLRISDERTPPVASERGYLGERLPSVYQDGEFGGRFLSALVTLRDPIVGTLDALPAYFDRDLAPRDVLDLLASWLGVGVDESWKDERVRHALLLAGELAEKRGTKQGLELVLSLSFPDVPLRVEDGGKVTSSTDPDAPPEASPNAFVVYCDASLDDSKQAAIARLIEEAKPAHVNYRLRVRTPRKRGNGEST